MPYDLSAFDEPQSQQGESGSYFPALAAISGRYQAPPPNAGLGAFMDDPFERAAYRRGPYRGMAAGREVSDWRSRDPEAAAQGTKDKWAGIYNDPASTVENLGVTGQIIGAAIRNAAPNRAEAAPAGRKQAAPPPTPEIMEEQHTLAAAGFYKDTPDGVDGPATKRARIEYQAAKMRERELAVQEGQLGLGEKKTEADILNAGNEARRLEQAEKTRLADKERRELGEARLRESDKNLSTYDKVMRAYGPTIGGVVGVATGIGARSGIKKLGDMYQASQAAKAEKTFEGVSGAVTKENLAERFGKVQDWWRRGGAKNEPFVSTPGKAPGIAVNVDSKGMPIGTPIKDLYNPNFLQTKGADLAGMSLPAAKGAFAEYHLPEAHAAFDKAKKDVDADPSDVNIEAYQTAKSRLSGLEAVKMAAVMGAVSYPAFAMAKPRYPIKPPTDAAETQRLFIENFLREGETASQKAAKSAATRQANAARKAEETARKADPFAPSLPLDLPPLPSNEMRKFDNHGNPINRDAGMPPPARKTKSRTLHSL